MDSITFAMTTILGTTAQYFISWSLEFVPIGILVYFLYWYLVKLWRRFILRLEDYFR